MGYYIQGPVFGKAQFIIDNYAARPVSENEALVAFRRGEGVIVVVSNPSFEAAGFIFSKEEFEAFAYPDGRFKQWLVMDRALAEKLSGFSG